MDLLVSYSWSHFARVRAEIFRILHRFGDEQAKVEKTAVPGISVVHSELNNRDVISKCKRLLETEAAFEFAIKWIPVDYWSDPNLDAMKQVIDDRIKGRIKEHETWAMQVKKRTWQQYDTIEIIDYLAQSIDRTVNLDAPDWIIHVDVLGEQTAIALLRPEEIFSLCLPYP